MGSLFLLRRWVELPRVVLNGSALRQFPDERHGDCVGTSATRAMESGPALIGWVLLRRIPLAAIWPVSVPRVLRAIGSSLMTIGRSFEGTLLANEENGETDADIPIRS
jgi:hypothetical protein